MAENGKIVSVHIFMFGDSYLMVCQCLHFTLIL